MLGSANTEHNLFVADDGTVLKIVVRLVASRGANIHKSVLWQLGHNKMDGTMPESAWNPD